MDTIQALRDLGVRDDTLSTAEKEFLDEQGYLPLPEILSLRQVEAMVARLETMAAAEGEDAGKEVHQEAGTVRLSDLINKDPIFDICFTHPRLLAGIAHVLERDLKLSSLNARAALPGHGLQALHMDVNQDIASQIRSAPEPQTQRYVVCNSIWLLTDFTEENGPTRLVPGSQRLGQNPREVLADPTQPHPDEIRLIAPAGTVVIFNSHAWHGGTHNHSGEPRRALHSYFCRRSIAQQLDQRAYIRPETYARLGEAARFILDV